ncbi:organic cation transporter-like protein [Folsomia candida]|uniref:organic cation transporter-like protein n=1 Tax=Folsomia candida TaxID=158441 RepID=UPI001604DFD4|nr:organic cation transporter-like protein [Folsomia candida]
MMSSTKISKRNSSVTLFKFEEVLEKLGGFGKFQILILVLLLTLEIPVAFVTFIPIFVAGKGSWECVSNDEIDPDSQLDICNCNTSLASSSDDSIVTEWHLVCEQSWVADFIMSIQMMGMFIGNIYGSQFADWYGRKTGFLLATLLLALGSTVSAISPNPYVYAIARFICGCGIPAYINITCMAAIEFMPPEKRSLSSAVGPTGEGIMILSILAYFFRPWRMLYWITVAPFSLIFLIYPFVPESPRWLLRNGRVDDAYSVLKYMAKVNGSAEVSLETLQAISDQEQKDRDETQNGGKRFGYLQFFRDKQLRTTSLYLMAIWFAWSFTYYGVTYNIKNVQGSIYLNVFLIGLANALGQRFAILINNRLGRRRTLFASMTFCALFLVALALCEIFVEASDPSLILITVIFCLLSQLGMACARSAARLLSGESFPTSVRTMGLGMGGIAANVAGVVTPQLVYLGSRWPSIPFFTFAIISVCGSLVSFLMTETTGKPLSDNIVACESKNEAKLLNQQLPQDENAK